MQILIDDHMDQCTEQVVSQLLPLVSAQRREQAMQYRHTFGQYCCLQSYRMLEQMIGPMAQWQYNEHGKPYLETGPHFSISHCKTGIAVAADIQPIGIDIESIRHADNELIERTMNETEQAQIHSAQDPDRAFTRLWTRKEAVLKANGIGLLSFEQIQHVLEHAPWTIQTVETDNYIYSIASK